MKVIDDKYTITHNRGDKGALKINASVDLKGQLDGQY